MTTATKPKEAPPPEDKALTPLQTFRDLLEKSKPQLLAAIPRVARGFDVTRLIRLVITTLQKTPTLLECDARSVMQAVMESAQLGLEPDGLLGHGFIYPYKIKGRLTAKFIVGYRGYIVLARRTADVATIDAHCFYEKDIFEFRYGTGQYLHHQPARGDRGDFIGVYCIVKFKDRHIEPKFVVLYKEDVDRVRAMSRMADGIPWTEHYEAMAQKTAIRNIAKTLGLSEELTRAAVNDEYADAGLSGIEVDVTGDAAEAATRARQKQLREKYGKEPEREEIEVPPPSPEEAEALAASEQQTGAREPGDDG